MDERIDEENVKTCMKFVKDNVFVDLENDHFKQRHDGQLERADLAKHSPERDQNGRRRKISVYQPTYQQ